MTALKIIIGILGTALGLLVLNFLIVAIAALFVDPKKEYYNLNRFYWLLMIEVAWIGIFFGRVKIHTTGTEKIPEGRFVYVANHRSKFDPLVAWFTLRATKMAFLTKEGNFHIPLYGRIIRRCCFLEIDRENPKKALMTIKKAAELIDNDVVSIGVYPEGTRNTTEDALLPFHTGVFKIAQKAHVPVVVATAKNTAEIAKNFPKKSTDVYLDILDVIPVEFLENHTSTEVGDLARDIMLKNLKS